MHSRRTVLMLLAAAGVVGCKRGSDTASAGNGKGLGRAEAGKPVPDVALRDGDDETASLADATGKPLLVNLWASWCAPCVKELPTLQALAQRPGAPRVIAVSQDMAPRSSVDAFADGLGLATLEIWHDPKMALSEALGAQVLPTTILFDTRGRELWRFVGDLDWTSGQAARLLAEAR